MRSATSGSVRKMPSMRMPPLVAMPAWWGLGLGLGCRLGFGLGSGLG